MTVLGLDVGDRRVGIAVSDPTELIARPLAVLVRRSNDAVGEEIARLVAANGARQIVVGLPVASDDSLGEQGRRTLTFIRHLRRHVEIPIVTVDERYSTREATRRLNEIGASARRRTAIDAAAAAVILEDWLDRAKPSFDSASRSSANEQPPEARDTISPQC